MRIFQPRFAAMLPIVVLVIVSSIISSISPVIAQVPSLPAMQSSVICGQVKFATVGSALDLVLLPFDNSGIALWQPQTFNQDAFYRIVNPQIAALNPPLQSAEFGSISRQIAGWSSYVQIAGPNDCNPPSRASLTLEVTAPGQLSVVNGQYAPDPFTVEATITNNGPVIATDVSIIFNLPDSLNATITTPGYDTTNPTLGNLAIGQQVRLSWSVKTDFLDTSQAATLGYSITVSASNADSRRIDRQTIFPAVPPPSPATNTPLPPTSVPSEIPTVDVPSPLATDTQTPVSQILSSISGRVTTSDGSGLPDVQITITDAAGKKVKSGHTVANGEYKISDLPPGVYIVTPSLDGYTFTPPSAEPATVPPKVEHQKFVGVPLVATTAIPSQIPTVIPTDVPTELPPTQAVINTVVPATTVSTETPRPSTSAPSNVLGTAIAKIEITAIDNNPKTIIQGEPVQLHVKIANRGERRLGQNWLFTGRIVVKDGKGVNIISEYDFEKGGSNGLDYANLDANESWNLHIDNVYFWKPVTDGMLIITVVPKDTTVGSTTISQTISITPNSLQPYRCLALVVSDVALVLPGGSGASTIFGVFGAELKAATIRGDPLSFSNITTLADAFVSTVAAVLPGTSASVIEQGAKTKFTAKDIAEVEGLLSAGAGSLSDPEGAKECANGSIWLMEIVKSFIKRGLPINGIAVYSPAYPLVTNQKGQRAGFLDDGTIVEEIPESKVVTVGEAKFVLYPSQIVETRLKGIGNGVMTVKLIYPGIQESTIQEFTYGNVPVSSSMVAIIDANDAQHTMRMDMNQDNIPDQFRSPDGVPNITLTSTTIAPTASQDISPTEAITSIAQSAAATPIPVKSIQKGNVNWIAVLVAAFVLILIILISGIALKRFRR